MAAKAKTEKKSDGAPAAPSFEERLERLEALGGEIRRTDIPLEESLKAFEEGIALSKGLEAELETIESRVEILVNGPDEGAGKKGAADEPVLDLFDQKRHAGVE
jgi:exodeoxyribonuclease VII small subunit